MLLRGHCALSGLRRKSRNFRRDQGQGRARGARCVSIDPVAEGAFHRAALPCSPTIPGPPFKAATPSRSPGTKARRVGVLRIASAAVCGECGEARQSFPERWRRGRCVPPLREKSRSRLRASLSPPRQHGAHELHCAHPARRRGGLGAHASAAMGARSHRWRLEAAAGKGSGPHHLDGRRLWPALSSRLRHGSRASGKITGKPVMVLLDARRRSATRFLPPRFVPPFCRGPRCSRQHCRLETFPDFDFHRRDVESRRQGNTRRLANSLPLRLFRITRRTIA